MTAQPLKGKVALITGAARGQGRAEAVRLARDGAAIIAVDICGPLDTTTYPAATLEDLDETVALVQAEEQPIVAVQADVRDFCALQDAVAEGVRVHGRLDIVVANAGMTTGAMSWEISLEQWKETIDINLTGAFHTLKATIPILIKQNEGGSIIIISSVAGLKGLPFLAHYCAAKHGVVGLAKSTANELAQYNIRVNTIHPFGVNTQLVVAEVGALLVEHAATLGPTFMRALPDALSEPEDVANAVAWLASDQARHVTGIQLPVDLGALIR